MKVLSWCVLLAAGAMAIGCMSTSRSTSSVSPVAGCSEPGITRCMTVAEVESKPGAPATVGSPTSKPNAQEADLEIQCPISPGFEGVQFRAAVPGFELAGAKLHPDTGKTRVMVGLHFTTRTIDGVHLAVELLDKESGKVLYREDHVEELGPEVTQIPAKSSYGVISRWNDDRAVWMDFPREASNATAIRVRVELVRHKS